MNKFVVIYNLLADSWKIFNKYKDADLMDEKTMIAIKHDVDVVRSKYGKVDEPTRKLATKLLFAIEDFLYE